uniref:Uncharacterized protein n=1 Tax=Sarcophilus harrisii TaxID=9305 RepID=A0A7N4V7C1_SARHA
MLLTAAMPRGLLLWDEAPNFEEDTIVNNIRFHDFLRDSWRILFSHPQEFTPIYTTELGGDKLLFTITDGHRQNLANTLHMLDSDEQYGQGIPVTAHVVFIFVPNKKLKLCILYTTTTGRNFDKILQVDDFLQFTAYKNVMFIPTLSEEAKNLCLKGIFTKELLAGKKYLWYFSTRDYYSKNMLSG